MVKAWKKYLGLAVFGLGTFFAARALMVDKDAEFKALTGAVQNTIIAEQDSVKELMKGAATDLRGGNYDEASRKFMLINHKLPTIERFLPDAYKVFENDLLVMEKLARDSFKAEKEFLTYYAPLSRMFDYYNDLAAQYKRNPKLMNRKVEFNFTTDPAPTYFYHTVFPLLEDLSNEAKDLSDDEDIKKDAVASVNRLINDLVDKFDALLSGYSKIVKKLPPEQHAGTYDEIINLIKELRDKTASYII